MNRKSRRACYMVHTQMMLLNFTEVEQRNAAANFCRGARAEIYKSELEMA